MRFRTLRVAVLCSSKAPGLEELLHHPYRGTTFEIDCVITTESWFPKTEMVERAGVPVLLHPIRSFCDERRTSVRDPQARREYDAATSETLRMLGVDSVLLLGYLYVLTDPMLKQFRDRILNIHDSDLSIRRPDGERCFVGLHSTREAMLAGERVTRSTVHVVTAKVDRGPIVLMSEAYPVSAAAINAVVRNDVKAVRQHAWMQRQAMMNDWGTLAARGLEYMACGIFDADMSGCEDDQFEVAEELVG